MSVPASDRIEICEDGGAWLGPISLHMLSCPQDIESVVFEASSSSTTLGSLWRNCSNGLTLLTSSNSYVAPVVKMSCSGKIYGNTWTTSGSCSSSDYVAWADTADLKTLASYDVDANSYNYQ